MFSASRTVCVCVCVAVGWSTVVLIKIGSDRENGKEKSRKR